MKLFQAEINRSLSAIAEKTIEIGRELVGKNDAGSRIKLLAYVDELSFMYESYKNLCFYLQVSSVTQQFGQTNRNFQRPPARHDIFEARKTSEACLIFNIQLLLQFLRDEHNLPVGELLEEVHCVTAPFPAKKSHLNQNHQRAFNRTPRGRKGRGSTQRQVLF